MRDILTVVERLLAGMLVAFIITAVGIIGIHAIYKLLVYLEMD
jgi:hypothetical protein